MHVAQKARLVLTALLLLLMAGCTAPTSVSNPGQYASIGVLPAYEPEISKRTPPGLVEGEVIEHFDLDIGLNKLVADHVIQAMGRTHKMVDLSSLSAAYVGTPKVHSLGERKIFNDSRPLYNEVVQSIAGSQGLDAYILIEGGPVWLYEPQEMPVIQLLAAQGHDLMVRLNISVIEGWKFDVVAASQTNLIQHDVPDTWFVAPKQHAEEIRAAVEQLLDKNLGEALQKLGLILQ